MPNLFIQLVCLTCIFSSISVEGFKLSSITRCNSISTDRTCLFSTKVESSSGDSAISPKVITNEIMGFFKNGSYRGKDGALLDNLRNYLTEPKVIANLDGAHVSVIMFQCARTRRMAKQLMSTSAMLAALENWGKKWSERDISTFVYGIRALDNTGVDGNDQLMLKLAARKISESDAVLSSRSIGNALYGLQDMTSDTEGANELCAALASKISATGEELNGQDIGIGLYGLQGMSSASPEVRKLVAVMAEKIKFSESELDAQAMSNALYGLQSMSSEHPEVLSLVDALAVKVTESRPDLSAQAIGSSLYGLQRLSSDAPEVRRLVGALAEKVEICNKGLDAQAIGNALFGLQNMKSDSVQVRALVQAIATKLVLLEVELDSKGIGAALYGLHSMSSDEPQVRALLIALADRISISKCSLSGQGIADALYGLYGMTSDCPELRALLSALSERIDETRGKLDSQEIGNALYGLQGMSSEMFEVRVIVGKLAEKIKRSKAVLRSQHIGRALMGLQRFSADSKEVRYLLKQLTQRIKESDRTKMTAAALSDAIFGMQGLSGDIPEVQELLGELAKKVSSTAAELTMPQLGRALFGLQGLSASGSIFEDSAVFLDNDEAQFLMSTLWDKVRMQQPTAMTEEIDINQKLAAISQGLIGIAGLRNPIGNNLRQYLYMEVIRMGVEIGKEGSVANVADLASEDIVYSVRALLLNDLQVPKWLAVPYNEIESVTQIGLSSVLSGRAGPSLPMFTLSRADKLVVQRYNILNPQPTDDEVISSNTLVDGFRLDILFPKIKLNIELDGPTHRYPARARFDRARDEYLVKKKGYTVHRIQLFGKKVDEIVKEIAGYVALAQDKKADIEIQSIYSKNPESMIQNIYAKDTGAEIASIGSIVQKEPLVKKYEIPRRKYEIPGRAKKTVDPEDYKKLGSDGFMEKK